MHKLVDTARKRKKHKIAQNFQIWVSFFLCVAFCCPSYREQRVCSLRLQPGHYLGRPYVDGVSGADADERHELVEVRHLGGLVFDGAGVQLVAAVQGRFCCRSRGNSRSLSILAVLRLR